MNSNNHTRRNDHAAQDYLRQVADAYFINVTTGLYQPKVQDRNGEIRDQSPGHKKNRPFFLHIKTQLTDYVLALAAILGLLISFCTLILLCLTVYYAHKQWTAAATANTLNEESSRNALKQAVTSNNTSRDSLVDVQRAFVYASPVITPLKGADGNPQGINIDISWQNSGSTPTRELSLIDRHNRTPEFEGDPMPFEKTGIGTSAKAFISPKGSYSSHVEVLGQYELQYILDKRTRYFLYGSASYKDVFNGTKEHVTKYCYQITPFYVSISSPNAAPSFLYDVRQCTKYNCLDDECKTN